MKRTDLQAVSLDQFNEVVKDRSSRKLLLRIFDVQPYILYLTLKECFGEPADKEPLEERGQWFFCIFTPHLALEIYDWKRESVSVGVYEREEIPIEDLQTEAKDFVAFLKKQTQKHSHKSKSARPRANTYYMLNPFPLYWSNAEKLLEQALLHPPDEIEELTGKYKELYLAAFFTYVASFESFVNLIYEIYLKPSLRESSIYDHLSRERILTKVQMAPIYCTCFRLEVIDSQTDSFKALDAIFKLRNRFIHANITPPLKIPIIEEDELEFWVSDRLFDDYDLPFFPDRLRQPHLEFVRDTITSNVEDIVSAMKPRYRKIFSVAMNSESFFLVKKDDGFELQVPIV